MMKRFLFLLPVLLSVFGLYCTSDVAGTTDETETGTVIYGYLIDATDNKPVTHALVRLFADSATDTVISGTGPASQPVDSAFTDTDGRYRFDSVATGNYQLESWFVRGFDTLQALHASVVHSGDSSTGSGTYVGIDTLKEPGSITGRVLFNGNGIAEAIVYIPATSFHTSTNNEGAFVLNAVPTGTYTVVYYRSGYHRVSDSGVVVLSDTVTRLDEKVLEAVFPIPADVKAVYLPLQQMVTVMWTPVAVDEVIGYFVFRKDSTATGLVPQLISGDPPITGGAYNDTLADAVFRESDSVVLQYQVQSAGDNGIRSVLSESVYVRVFRKVADSRVTSLDPLITSDVTLMPDSVRISHNVTVADGVTLSITPGTVLLFETPYALTVRGRLLAIGTPADSIVFTCADGTDSTGWGGIQFDSVGTGNDTSKILWCRIEKTRSSVEGLNSGNGGAIFCNHAARLIISNNTISGNFSYGAGGGIYCYGSSPVISGNAITGNRSGTRGGGICCLESGIPVIENNLISFNTAGIGGGIYCEGLSTPVISNNAITCDTALNNAGGVYFGCNSDSNPPMTGNTITGNVAKNGGGCICWNYHGDFTNNTVTDNSASTGAGGMAIYRGDIALVNCLISRNNGVNGGGLSGDNTSLRIVNSTIANNYSRQDGGAIVYSGNDSMVVDNTIIWGNATNNGTTYFFIENDNNVLFGIRFRFSCVQNERLPDNGNIAVYPVFTDSANGDFTLMRASRCIDAGGDLLSPDILTDLAGNPRVVGDGIDMGAFER